jgi:GH25 family lysozyme M1 (1,4-beta-N-acetylmuramidase)
VTQTTVVQGLDISDWQGAYDWEQWKGRIGFGAAKAAEGDAVTDPDFGHNWNAMWELDRLMPRFAYLYFHAGLDPVVQAAHLVATVRGHGLLPGDNFLFDFEETEPGSGRNDGIPPAVAAARARICLQRINDLAPGHRVLVYLSPSFAAEGNSDGLDPWHLWAADYGVDTPAVPAPWKTWTFWQWTDQPVDRDRFNGTGEQLLEFCRMPAKR